MTDVNLETALEICLRPYARQLSEIEKGTPAANVSRRGFLGGIVLAVAGINLPKGLLQFAASNVGRPNLTPGQKIIAFYPETLRSFRFIGGGLGEHAEEIVKQHGLNLAGQWPGSRPFSDRANQYLDAEGPHQTRVWQLFERQLENFNRQYPSGPDGLVHIGETGYERDLIKGYRHAIEQAVSDASRSDFLFLIGCDVSLIPNAIHILASAKGKAIENYRRMLITSSAEPSVTTQETLKNTLIKLHGKKGESFIN